MNNDPKRHERYGYKILAKNHKLSMDTWETGLNNNVCCIAGSGHGKTTGFVEPNLIESQNSLIVADTKGQLARRYTKMFRDKGYQIYTLDLIAPKHSCGYNPLKYIRRYEDGHVYEQDILTIANIIQGKNDTQDPFWDQVSLGYISFLISFAVMYDLPENERNMITVNKLHHVFMQPDGSQAFEGWIRAHPDSFAAQKYAEINALRDADRTFSCVMSFASVALQCFGHSEAKFIFGNNSDEIELNDLGKKKTVLFINSSDVDFTFSKISTLFYTQLFQVLTAQADVNPDGRLTVPVDIYMDDFTCSASAIPDFDRIISVIRSRDISVNIMLQSLEQLEQMYKHNAARTIIDNCDTILYMGCNSPETATFIGARAFKTPEHILCGLPRDKMWIIKSGQKAILADKILAGTYPVPSTEEPDSHDWEYACQTPFDPYALDLCDEDIFIDL